MLAPEVDDIICMANVKLPHFLVGEQQWEQYKQHCHNMFVGNML